MKINIDWIGILVRGAIGSIIGFIFGLQVLRKSEWNLHSSFKPLYIFSFVGVFLFGFLYALKPGLFERWYIILLILGIFLLVEYGMKYIYIKY